ncbi:carboxypeptidase-like regulatory domain-containing protein [Chryseosolibacter indicus]|uniref:Carboxypeptidase-like regulatory domain-containing protein n=1 Tax=Chryseosolibacter indicus TaxID=2782351 RepID=A0ABS5VVV2_9BACT|nr:carboxypeptidase-like regulatory domain-containing protein [Chryseosolibacter indicus]
MKKLFYLLFLLLPFSVWSQSITLSAKVQDSESNAPLAFASVGIKGQPIGTISNDQGEFDFHFPLDLRNDTLVISMLGYKNFEAPVSTLLDKQKHVILLEKSEIILQEIVVADTLTGGDILRIAMAKIEDNYPMQPFLLEAFYRDVKKVGGTYISLLEAAVKIFDENYEEPRNQFKLRERVRLMEVRKSYGYESKFTTYFNQDNLLEDLLLNNNIRYRLIPENDSFYQNMNRDKNSYYDGHEIYVISQVEDYTIDNKTYSDRVKFYIDKENFAITHFEWERKADKDLLTKKKNMISKFISLNKTLDFRRYKGKMYPSFLTMTTKVNWYDVNTDQLKFETELFQQLLVNKVHDNPTERIRSTEKMRNYGLQYQDQPYNKAFWDNYNVIKESPLEKKVLSDLEKAGPLEKQFAEY